MNSVLIYWRSVLSCLVLFFGMQQVCVAEGVSVSYSSSSSWLMVATVFVLMMSIPGISLFYSGLVRVKNAISIQYQVLSCFTLVLLLWLVFGYALTFSDFMDGSAIIKKLALSGMEINEMIKINHRSVSQHSAYLYALFQGAFAAIACSIIVGALAERARWSGMLVFVVVWFVLAYIPVAHVIWHKSTFSGQDGFLHALGALDYAGGLVVHINAGVAGLIASYMLGARADFGKKPLTPHSMNNVLTGAAFLWLGWVGFNAGSALVADQFAVLAFVNTFAAPVVACLTWVLIERWKYGKSTILGAVTGILCGLICVTPMAGYVAPWAAMLSGLLAAFFGFKGVSLVKRRWKIDDALDVFAIHGICGILGSLLVGVFAFAPLGGTQALPVNTSLLMAIIEQLKLQALSVVLVAVISGLASVVAFLAAKHFSRIRANSGEEEFGLDASEHAETVYNFSNE